MAASGYQKPEVKDFGSLQDLTQQTFNKIGQATDVYSTAQNQLVGSIVPSQP
jgi:hypothetical protein